MTPQQHYKKVKDRRSGRIWEVISIRVTDFEFLLAQIFNLIPLQEKLGGTNPIKCDKILALTLRYLATGESFQSLSRISLNLVSYIIKSCCKAIVERMASAFVKVPSTKAEWVDISRKFPVYCYTRFGGNRREIYLFHIYDGSFYYNYKHSHFIILIAIKHPQYDCLHVDVKSNGRVNDSGI